MLRALRLSLPTDTWARFLLVPVLAFIATAIDRNYQTDFWHHLARGRAMAESGSLVDRDLFTFTVADRPFQDVNWLTQLFYYWLYEHGGLNLVQCINSLTLSLVLAGVVWLCWRACGSLVLANALGILTLIGLWQVLIIRPQTFSLLLFVLLYAVLIHAERRRWLLLLAPPILALWTNLHGGFPIGLVLVGSFALAAGLQQGIKERAQLAGLRNLLRFAISLCLSPWSLCLAFCVLATLINPYGWKVYQYVQTTSATAAGRHIDEWVPPGMDQLIGKVWMLTVLALLVLFARARRRPTLREICLVVCFLPLACGSVRMIAWWLLVSTPILAALAVDSLPQGALLQSRAEGRTVGAFGFCGILAFAGVLSLPWLERYNPALGTVRDCHRTEADLDKVAEQLAQRPEGGRIFSRFEWGEYLGWSLAGRDTVFMDGRIEIYPDDVWADYSVLTQGRADWQQILDRYRVDYLLLDRTYHGDLLPLVEHSSAWKPSLQVGNAILFERTERPAQERGAAIAKAG